MSIFIYISKIQSEYEDNEDPDTQITYQILMVKAENKWKSLSVRGLWDAPS